MLRGCCSYLWHTTDQRLSSHSCIMALPLLKLVHFLITSILQTPRWSQKAARWSGYQDTRMILQPKAENMFFSYSFYIFVFQEWIFSRLTQKTQWICACYHYIIDTHFYSYFYGKHKWEMIIFISNKDLPTRKSRRGIEIDNTVKKNLIHLSLISSDFQTYLEFLKQIK